MALGSSPIDERREAVWRLERSAGIRFAAAQPYFSFKEHGML